MSLINQVLQDLEKRHASESELNSLPHHVRAVGRPRSPGRTYLVAAIIAAVVVAVAFFIYASRRGLVDDRPQIVSKPIAQPLPEPVAAPTLPVAPPVAEPLAQTAAFSPVSRLSDGLNLVTPRQAHKENLAVLGRSSKPVVATSTAEIAPLPQTEKLQVPVMQTPPTVEAATQPPPVPASERVTTPPPEPIIASESTPAAIDKQMREVVPSERAEIAFRKGATQIQEGRANAAELEFRDALKQDPSHAGARQALLGLLLDSGRNNEAEQLMRKALEINPRQPRHAMVLARLEVERGEVTGAINTMVGALPYVQSDPDFHAFLAALLQREERHREAVDYYRVALRGVPGNGVWSMGLGISLRAANQSAEAREAFQRAIESKQLNPELQSFVERQLRELSAPKKK
ncbi:MAG: tetratricopeptide repeat protein [Prolixibacteraceae bacterium]|nr:tetratricopeptide repeat protein [Burkholderiales bacterium]